MLIERWHHISTPKTKLPQTFGDVRGSKISVNGAGVRVIQQEPSFMGKFTTLLRATGLAVTVAMPAAAQDASTVLATVNGKDITLGHVIALQDNLPDQYQQLEDGVLYNGILEQLVQQTALADEMAKNMTPALELGLENERGAFLSSEFIAQAGSAEISEDALQAAYDARFANVEPEQEFNASHILVEEEEAAKEIVQMLADGADFATLAKEKSTGPSGPRGGELGWFGKGQMVPEFEQAVIGLEDGAVSEPVKTQFGWHVVMRNDSRNKAAPTLDSVRGDLESELKSKAVDDAMAKVTEAADITYVEVEIDPAIIRNVELLSK